MTRKLREPEITSLVRKFFRTNGFEFLSNSSSGEKLYYTIGGNKLNNKQPDTIIFKNDLLILCEDKIQYNLLFSSRNKALCDYDKLLTFLMSDQDQNAFKQKVSLSLKSKNYNIVGCLSSLASKTSKYVIDHPLIINLSIERLEKNKFTITLNASERYRKYFEHWQLSTEL